jgi:hypothetical protein
MKTTLKACVIHGVLAVFGLCSAYPADGQTISYFQTGEEFAGPFPSWKNVMDFGAKGDGVTDDAAAIGEALAAMDVSKSWGVLYFPAGTYMIQSTASTGIGRKQSNLGLTIVGEDPATTVITCGKEFTSADADQGAMMLLDATYGGVSRITLDGRNKAAIGILFDGDYATDWQVTDMVFRNCGTGLQFGGRSGVGKDMTLVERCTFENCGNGFLSTNQNAMGIYIWHNLFKSCDIAANFGVGYFQTAGNVFLGSKVSDISRGTINSAVINNVSVGSKTFFNGAWNLWNVNLAMGNRIYNTTDARATVSFPVMIDNVIRSAQSTGPVVDIVDFQCKNTVMIGNTFTVQDPVRNSRKHRLYTAQERIVDTGQVPVPAVIPLPGVPRNHHRNIYEVATGTGDDAAEIQRKIDTAAKDGSFNPVVHLPKGRYVLKRTVVLPAGKAMQIVGDGALGLVTISWAGGDAGPGFKLMGPSRVTMRNLYLAFEKSNADGILVDDCDQVGGRIYLNQAEAQGKMGAVSGDVNYFVDGVENSDVSVFNTTYTGAAKQVAVVKGGPALASSGTAPGQVSFIFGYAGKSTARMLEIQDGGRLLFLGYRCEGSVDGYGTLTSRAGGGSLTFACNNYGGTRPWTAPMFTLDSFDGSLVSVASCIQQYGVMDDPSFVITGKGDRCRALSLGDNLSPFKDDPAKPVQVHAVWKDDSSPAAAAAIVNGSASAYGSRDLADVSDKALDKVPDTSFILDGLQHLRATRFEPPTDRPEGVTDVKLMRIIIVTNKTGFHFRGSAKPRSNDVAPHPEPKDPR